MKQCIWDMFQNDCKRGNRWQIDGKVWPRNSHWRLDGPGGFAYTPSSFMCLTFLILESFKEIKTYKKPKGLCFKPNWFSSSYENINLVIYYRSGCHQSKTVSPQCYKKGGQLSNPPMDGQHFTVLWKWHSSTPNRGLHPAGWRVGPFSDPQSLALCLTRLTESANVDFKNIYDTWSIFP